MAMVRSGRDEPDLNVDPDAAAVVVERVSALQPDAAERLHGDPRLRSMLLTVAAASPWLARLCATDDAALDVLAKLDSPVDFDSFVAGAAVDGLGRAKRLGILRIAARDLAGLDDLEAVTANLADLAEQTLKLACRLSTASDIAVIGMGKLGGRELNYSSDVDLILVGDPAGHPRELRSFLELARSAWRIDLNLRPEGRSGPLVRSLESFIAYWDRWANTWEFQALLKARPVAGRSDLGARFLAEASERVWSRPFGAVQLREVRTMKERSEAEVSRRGIANRELKRGRGGIRDVEFAIQLLQMVHGRADPSLRSTSTLQALRTLASGGYVGQADAADLERAYVFLRTVEHRLQLHEDEQTHLVPDNRAARSRLARVLGYRDDRSASALAAFETDLRRHQSTVRRIHERLFFRPLLEAFTFGPPAPGAWTARTGEGVIGMASGAAEQRLEAFGFTDAARTSAAVRELTRGFSRTSQLMQHVLPMLLDWLSEAPDPDLGLLGLRSLAGTTRSRDELTALCRESPEAARQLCELLGTGPGFTRGFQHNPDRLTALADRSLLAPVTRDHLSTRVRTITAWRPSEAAVQHGLRLFTASETLRIAARDVLGVTDGMSTAEELSNLAEVVVETVLQAESPLLPMIVVGMGRLGGRELAYSSDLDLLFVYEVPQSWNSAEASAEAERIATSVIRVIGGPTPANRLYRVDTALRPEGRHGPQARSLEAYAAYYARWAQVWERQALLRGRVIAGETNLGERYATLARSFVWDRPLAEAEVREIRRTKARVERERVPAAEDPEFHLKLGPGALADVEWTVQLLQLQNGVVACGTVEAIEELTARGVLSAGDAKVLSASYRFCEQTRNRLALVRDIPSDSLPSTGHTLTVLARSLGTTAAGLRDEYRRHTRRARQVVLRLFYGGDGPS